MARFTRFPMDVETMQAGVLGMLADGVAVHDPADRLLLACPTAARILERVQAPSAGACLQWYVDAAGVRSARAALFEWQTPERPPTRLLAHAQVVAQPDHPWLGCVISTFVEFANGPADGCAAAGQTLVSPGRRAIEEGQIGAWRFDPLTQVFHWDTRMFEIYGLPAQDPVPRTIWHDSIEVGDQARFRRALLRVLGGEGREIIGFRIRRADGAWRDLLMIAAAAFDSRRQPTGMAGLILDQTGHAPPVAGPDFRR